MDDQDRDPRTGDGDGSGPSRPAGAHRYWYARQAAPAVPDLDMADDLGSGDGSGPGHAAWAAHTTYLSPDRQDAELPTTERPRASHLTSHSVEAPETATPRHATDDPYPQSRPDARHLRDHTPALPPGRSVESPHRDDPEPADREARHARSASADPDHGWPATGDGKTSRTRRRAASNDTGPRPVAADDTDHGWPTTGDGRSSRVRQRPAGADGRPGAAGDTDHGWPTTGDGRTSRTRRRARDSDADAGWPTAGVPDQRRPGTDGADRDWPTTDGTDQGWPTTGDGRSGARRRPATSGSGLATGDPAAGVGPSRVRPDRDRPRAGERHADLDERRAAFEDRRDGYAGHRHGLDDHRPVAGDRGMVAEEPWPISDERWSSSDDHWATAGVGWRRSPAPYDLDDDPLALEPAGRLDDLALPPGPSATRASTETTDRPALPSARRPAVIGDDRDYPAVLWWTAIWWAVPAAVFAILIFVSGSARAASAVADHAVGIVVAVLLSLGAAWCLRWLTLAWRAISVGFAATIIGAGLTTMVVTALA